MEVNETILKAINLEKSFFYINASSDKAKRTSVESVLTDKNNNITYYLTKECRSEHIGKYPFSHHGLLEFLYIIEKNDDKYAAHDLSFEAITFFKNIKSQKNLAIINSGIETNRIKTLGINEVIEILRSKKLRNIFCEINYENSESNYSLISKCEFINFSGETEQPEADWIQIIGGYVPFVTNKKIYISYFAKYLSLSINGNLEFLSRIDTFLFNYSKINTIYKKGSINRIIYCYFVNSIKFVLNKLLFFLKKAEFQKRTTIDKSKIMFFEYI